MQFKSCITITKCITAILRVLLSTMKYAHYPFHIHANLLGLVWSHESKDSYIACISTLSASFINDGFFMISITLAIAKHKF